MPYDGVLLARARAELDRIRDENQAEQIRRREQVYARVPEVQQIDQRLRSQMTQLLRLTIAKKPDLAERIGELRRENLALQQRRAHLLQERGWPADYLDSIYSCPVCRDTGLDGTRPCRCLEALYNREMTRELSGLLRRGDERFERFDLSLYSDRLDPVTRVVPRDTMRFVYETCLRFAENFPQVSRNLLLQGGTGLGKTFLSACIAREVAAKGCSVCYDSCSAALDAFERQKFSRDPEEAEAASVRVKRMLSCDLLILDDLGTEMVTPMSLSALYTLIDSRLVNGKKTIISTNCSDEKLRRMYTPQICSRLEGEFLALPFVGSDIRLLKKPQ